MANIGGSTLSNILYQCRMKAAESNDRLASREGVEGITGIGESRLYRLENDAANPYPDEIVLMARLYGCPELKNWYCRQYCPIGKNLPEVKDLTLDRISVRIMASMERLSDQRGRLLNLVEDGIISEQEKPVLEEIIQLLDSLNEDRLNLKNWTEKHLKEEGR